MPNTISVYMVDDHEFILAVTKEYLEANGITVLGNSTSYEGALAHAFDGNPDVIVIDMNLAGRSGIDLTKELKEIRKDVKILIFSARTSLPAIAAAYRAGAIGYLTKSSEPSNLISAINKVSQGHIYYMPEYAEKILNYQTAGVDPDPRTVLTKREYEIFLEIAKGTTLEKVSSTYDITQRSITNRISDIRKKLNNHEEDFAIIANRHGITFIRD